MAIKLTKQQQQTIFAVALAVIGGSYVYWNYLLKPQLTAIKDRQAKLADLTTRIETVERQARRLPALQAEREKLRLELAGLEKQLPKDRDIPNIIRILTREAIQENLVFTRLGPKTPARKDFFETIPFDLQFTGTLHALGRFLSSLGQQDRIFQAQGITLSPTGGSDTGIVSLTITLTIVTYAYAG
jgi:type IV pilus assembly protein PilO